MRVKTFFFTLFSAIFCIVALSSSFAAEGNWEDELERLRSRFRRSIEKEININAVAKKLNLVFPLPKQKVSREDVKRIANENALKLLDRQIPLLDEEALVESAKVKYKLWELGDKVFFTDSRGKKFSGMLTYISQRRIILSEKYRISGFDFSDEMRAHLFKEDSLKAQKLSVQVDLEKNKKERSELFTQLLASELDRAYEENQFIKFMGNWQTSEEMMTMLETRRNSLVNRNYEKLIKKYLKRNGFVEFEYEWMPKALADKEKERLRDKKESKRRKKASRKSRKLGKRGSKRDREEDGPGMEDEPEREIDPKLAREAKDKADEEIPEVVNGLLEDQSKGYDGVEYWEKASSAKKLFKPTEWEITNTTVKGLSAITDVNLESETEDGHKFKKKWQFFLTYVGAWRISAIKAKKRN